MEAGSEGRSHGYLEMVLVMASVPMRADCTSTVGPVVVSVLINIVLRNGLAPGCATLELSVVGVDTGINNVHANALTAGRFMLVESKGSEDEPLASRNTRETLKHNVSISHAVRAGSRNVPIEQSAEETVLISLSCCRLPMPPAVERRGTEQKGVQWGVENRIAEAGLSSLPSSNASVTITVKIAAFMRGWMVNLFI